MHAMFPIAIRASEVLGVDAELRPLWKEVLDNLAPVPRGMQPAIFYDLVTVGSENNAMTRSVVESYQQRYSNTGIDEHVKMNVGNKSAVVAANLGQAEHVGRVNALFVVFRVFFNNDEFDPVLQAYRFKLLCSMLAPVRSVRQ